MPDWKKKWMQRLPAILLLVGSVLFWSVYDRYEPVGPVLLSAPTLAEATRVSGDSTGIGGLFTLHVPEGGKTARIDFDLPDAIQYQLIRVRGRIKVDGVIKGKYPWHCARLLLTQYNARNQWIPGEHGLVAEGGSKDWAVHEDVFEIFPDACRAVVNIQQAGLVGTAWFDRIEAEPVQLRASFIWFRLLSAVLWITAGILYFTRCRLHRRRLKLLILLNALAIIAGALMPGDWLEKGADVAKETIAKLEAPAQPVQPKAPAIQPKPTVKKKPVAESARFDSFNRSVGNIHRTGHFALFASLCFLVYLSAALERQHPVYFAKVAFDILLFAAITEALQYLTMDRTAGWRDLRVDVYGMAAAFALFVCCLPLLRWRLRR